jgi:type IV secretion system protein VirB9
MRNRYAIAALLATALLGVSALAQPIVTDSRIKTFVFNENEVFNITTHYGYQANVEFGGKEEIETVSVGDRVAWQIVPAGRRLFIRAMEENAHTNMTIVTSKRAYQFDLRSSASDAVYGSEELTYVVRFFYPEDGGLPPTPIAMPSRQPAATSYFSQAAPTAPVYAAPLAPAPMPAPAPVAYAPPPSYPTGTYSQPAPQQNYSALPSPTLLDRSSPAPMPPVTTVPYSEAPAASSNMNYRYTYTGPNEIAPVKIYDDGRATYFKFRDTSRLPRLAVINGSGQEVEVPYQLNAEGLAVVNTVASRFSLRNNGAEVVVYNEARAG